MEEEGALNTIGFNVTPINNNCSGEKKIIVSNNSSDPSTLSNQNIDNVTNQAKQDSSYDRIDTETLKPLYGGANLKDYQIIYKKKIFFIKSNQVEEALHQIAKMVKIKNHALFETQELNKKSSNHIYHYKNNKKPIIIKIK